MPRVSVVIPTYNRADRLGGAIDSVLGQTLADLELVVVVDGSTDGTVELLERLAQGDARVRHVVQPNRGVGAARNHGILASRAQLIAFLDDDDRFLPGKLEAQCELLDRRPDLGWSYTYLEEVDERNGVNLVLGRAVRSYGELYRGYFVGTSTVLVRRAVLERSGLFLEDRRLWGAEDSELWLRLAKVAPFDCIARPLARRHLTHRHDWRQWAHHKEGSLYKFRHLDLSGQADISRWTHWKKVAGVRHDLGLFYLQHGEHERARLHLLLGLLANPLVGRYAGSGLLAPFRSLWRALLRRSGEAGQAAPSPPVSDPRA